MWSKAWYLTPRLGHHGMVKFPEAPRAPDRVVRTVAAVRNISQRGPGGQCAWFPPEVDGLDIVAQLHHVQGRFPHNILIISEVR